MKISEVLTGIEALYEQMTEQCFSHIAKHKEEIKIDALALVELEKLVSHLQHTELYNLSLIKTIQTLINHESFLYKLSILREPELENIAEKADFVGNERQDIEKILRISYIKKRSQYIEEALEDIKKLKASLEELLYAKKVQKEG
ncbi:hypothetical protein [Priestia endophytica]|jgi:hypothetical protein|uniref:Uncharacterized protein n=2 Tax=Priestia endophytica TaxID=135735 RepID=A0AAX1Q3G0_9BACI|nr:hypothetical protein [Priestia endophytica]KYG31276.1 hypothetical protein AZF06_05895 [Priestia endophytica]MCM3536699.1 hypothetical protein [Priestia endophytica]RAS72269.1 hypothetical protein A3864_24685 [Priestia endophytica]RAS73903.1 hypothetical protein A4U60_22135 [Priestia endophytica]RAS83237.1 hypothetical protein A4R27_06355 [Priestia endophytica]